MRRYFIMQINSPYQKFQRRFELANDIRTKSQRNETFLTPRFCIWWNSRKCKKFSRSTFKLQPFFFLFSFISKNFAHLWYKQINLNAKTVRNSFDWTLIHLRFMSWKVFFLSVCENHYATQAVFAQSEKREHNYSS